MCRESTTTTTLLYSPDDGHKKHVVWMGGPETRLPRFVEAFLGWCLAIACLSISGYHYLRQTVVQPMKRQWHQRHMTKQNQSQQDTKQQPTTSFPDWLPLTTCSRQEMAHQSPLERLEQLQILLSIYCRDPLGLSNHGLKELIRSKLLLRRLATLAMRPIAENHHPSVATPLGQRLVQIWPQLLALSINHSESSMQQQHYYAFEISLIIPAYKEDGRQVLEKLKRALQECQDPSQVDVVVIDAGACHRLDLLVDTTSLQGKTWGNLRLIPYKQGGGRGPCLNFGSRHAQGRILAFCHSDTRLPKDWDARIQSGLSSTKKKTKSPIACAFGFGIDTSPLGLQGGPYPPGIRAVEATANVRTRAFSLPYGDQCLSLPRSVFDYLGGFPDQCLMEDYELVSLVRQRAALLPEELVILPGPPALCSPRRWQRFGVLYVTYTNSKCVTHYAAGMTPDDLWKLYYGRPPPPRSQVESPFDLELHQLLSSRDRKKKR